MAATLADAISTVFIGRLENVPKPQSGFRNIAFGGIETKRVLDGRANLRRRLDRVGPRVDDAQPSSLPLERHEVAGALGGVFEHELRDVQALEIRRERLIAAADSSVVSSRLQLPRQTCTPIRTPSNARRPPG